MAFIHKLHIAVFKNNLCPIDSHVQKGEYWSINGSEGIYLGMLQNVLCQHLFTRHTQLQTHIYETHTIQPIRSTMPQFSVLDYEPPPVTVHTVTHCYLSLIQSLHSLKFIFLSTS